MLTAVRILAVTAFATSAAALAGPPPVEAFFRNVEFDDLKLSPDGKFLAAIARIEAAPDARNLVVLDIDAMKSKVLTGYENEDIRNFEWASDELVAKHDRRLLYPDAYRMTTDNGHLQKSAANERNSFAWYADNAGIVRAALDSRQESVGRVSTRHFYRPTEVGPTSALRRPCVRSACAIGTGYQRARLRRSAP